MSTPTPRTDKHYSMRRTIEESREFSSTLETELAESHARVLSLIAERDRYKFQAEQKITLRREIEEALGITTGDASDEALAKGVAAIRALQAENQRLREALEGLANMPEYDQDDAHRLRHKSKQALNSTKE